ncbi:MAG: nickel-dependent lactate racemase [Mogibacterium sp.]|nr:nickel-dependent lactate racemase [Mogibacterium sp.]
MRIELRKGTQTESVEIRDECLTGILEPEELVLDKGERELVEEALDHPIGTGRIEEIVQPGDTVAILTSDPTRPMPTGKVLPSVLRRLERAGVRLEDITVYIARGNHRETTEEERRQLIGAEAAESVRCVDSDPHDVVSVGVTKRGTPVDIDRRVLEADRRICLGNIEYHYFAGYSGGAKAIMPGCSTRAAIQANHRMMASPDSHIGKLEGNPVREDIEEAAAMVGADCILNVVIDTHKRIVWAGAGDLVEAHRAGCRFLDTMYRFELEREADIVIVSQGGAPKDLNLYQTQKALENARHAVRPGGIIILVGSCREGLGNDVFEAWMREAATPHELVERIGREFVLGGHKAAMVAEVCEKADVYLVSDLEDSLVREIFMTPYASVSEAYAEAVSKLGPEASVLVMPYGGSTVPVCRNA